MPSVESKCDKEIIWIPIIVICQPAFVGKVNWVYTWNLSGLTAVGDCAPLTMGGFIYVSGCEIIVVVPRVTLIIVSAFRILYVRNQKRAHKMMISGINDPCKRIFQASIGAEVRQFVIVLAEQRAVQIIVWMGLGSIFSIYVVIQIDYEGRYRCIYHDFRGANMRKAFLA